MELDEVWIWRQIEFEIGLPSNHDEQVSIRHRKGLAHQIRSVRQQVFDICQPSVKIFYVYLFSSVWHMRVEQWPDGFVHIGTYIA